MSRGVKKTINLSNVTECTVHADLCVGCGVCVAVCPAQVLRLDFVQGEYRLKLIGKCLPKCRVCLKVCPFGDYSDSVDDLAELKFGMDPTLKKDSVIGYYRNAYIGHSTVNGHRENGASGGMVTWLLEYLLSTGRIDKAIVVLPRMEENKPLFQMSIVETAEQIRQAAGSRYYPVEISESLCEVLTEQQEFRYAVVGTPCLVQALSRARAKYKKLDRRIEYVLGLACGLCPSAQYTEVLAAWAGVLPQDIRTVGYRFKDGIEVGWDFRFRAQDSSGRWSRPVGQLETFRHLWGRHFFAHHACLFCDDVFAELADAVFMDAWLPEYLTDTRGASIVVTRNINLDEALQEGSEKKLCNLLSCPIDEVHLSQKSVIMNKRETIRKRVAFAQQNGYWLPEMRVKSSDALCLSERDRIAQDFRIVRGSKIIWPLFRRLPVNTLPFYLKVVDIYAIGLFRWIKRESRFAGLISRGKRQVHALYAKLSKRFTVRR